MCFLDIDELDTVFDSHPFWSYNESNLAWFNPKNYIGRDSDIRSAVTAEIKKHRGKDFTGRICLLTHLTYFGYCFNPVSFYYCYDPEDNLQFIVSEITNTPWGERHVYVTEVNGPEDSENQSLVEDSFKKIFHVSPFLDMDFQYHWKFNHPEDQLIVNMDNHKNGEPWFNAYLQLDAKPVTKKNLSLALRKYPMMTLKVILAIHWQALKLKLKGAKFYDHPNPDSLRTTD
jgi:DUF1365 family protein